MRNVALIAASAAFVASLVSSVSSACDSKPCRADFDCDLHHICMRWPNGSATCESPGANPVMPASRRTNAQSCQSDLECPEGWRCDRSARCAPESRQRISY